MSDIAAGPRPSRRRCARMAGVLGTVLAAALMGCEQPASEQAASDAGERPAAPPLVSVAGDTLFATSTFPFGPKPEQVEATFRIARENSQLYMIQLDDGVPWAEALADKPWPSSVERKWRDLARRAPAGVPVYLALEPLDQDRTGLAPAIAGSSTPRSIQGASFDSEPVVQAYLAYARRAVERFNPTYLNLGVENGELAHRKPSAWPAYTRLIRRVYEALKRERPDMLIGVSFGLQSLMEPATARRCRDFVESLDFLGLSFYPYMSSFHEKFGVSPLPPPPDEWRKPLEWVRRWTDKPIAVTETGYNTKDMALPEWGIRMRGSEALQEQYVRELAAYALRDDYLFVIYYLPIDIGPLLDSLPKEARAFGDMWRDNGLYTAQLRPKPAHAAWQAALRGDLAQDASPPPQASPPSQAEQPAQTASTAVSLGFASEADLFQAPPQARVRLDLQADAPGAAAAMRWRYDRKPGETAWAVRSMTPGLLRGLGTFELDARSDRAGPIILQVKESSGESFYTTLALGTSWRPFTISFDQLQLDEATRVDGRLAPEEIVAVVLADMGQGAPSEGQRRKVWLARWIAR